MFIGFANEDVYKGVGSKFQALKNNLFFELFVDDIQLSEYSRASMICSVIRF